MAERPACIAYLALSLDGCIADARGGIDWLNAAAAGVDDPGAFERFLDGIDAILMGRRTYEQVLGFGVWPYTKPVHVLSTSLGALPGDHEDRATLAHGSPPELCAAMAAAGHRRLYVDGGTVVRAFLAADLIDEMTLTTVPVILGAGMRLFDETLPPSRWSHAGTRVIGDRLSQSTWRRRADAAA